jgi:hypothetical protein
MQRHDENAKSHVVERVAFFCYNQRYDFYKNMLTARNNVDCVRKQKTAENKTADILVTSVKIMSRIFDKPSKSIKRLACI